MLDNRKELHYLTLALSANLINVFSYVDYVTILTEITPRNIVLSAKVKTEIRRKYRNIIPNYKPVLLSEINKGLALHNYKRFAIKHPKNIDFKTFGMYAVLFK